MTLSIPMFSGGAGSYVAALREVERVGVDNVRLLFTDVKGDNPSRHAGEDIGTYRFMAEAAADVFGVRLAVPPQVLAAERDELTEAEEFDAYLRLRDVTQAALGDRLVWLHGDEDIWAVYRRRRRIGSGYAANCSFELKQRPARDWIDAHCDPDDTTIALGIDWTESQRIPGQESAYAHSLTGCSRPRKAKGCTDTDQCDACRRCRPCTEADPCSRRLERPWRVTFPLIQTEPRPAKPEILALTEARGIRLPRLYARGFPHSNCGGFCVKMGKTQATHLLRVDPERYRYHERQEQDTRVYLGRDVAIYTETVRREQVPLTLETIRERGEAQSSLFGDDMDWGGCGCMTDDVPDDYDLDEMGATA